MSSTMWWRWLGAAAMGLASTLGGCVIEGGPGPTATELYRLIDAHCANATRCGCAFAAVASDACTTELEARWKARLSVALERGLRYDAECFAAITAQIEEYACYWPGGEMPLCDRYCAPLHGERAEGEACEADGDDGLVSDCAQGLYCLAGTCTTPCAALGGRREGQACGNEALGPYDDCAAGLQCSWASGRCEAQPSAGASCFDSSCGEDLYCDWQTNTCVPAAAPGQACSEIPCVEGYYCNWQTNTCVPAAGEGEDCNEVPCTDDLFCEWQEAQGTAACRRYAAEGEGCWQRPCEDMLWCDESNRCASAPTEGEPCLYDSICAEGLLCDPTMFLCTLPPAEGQPCPAGECAWPAWCDTALDPMGICTARRAIDEPCAGHRQCESGYCPNGFCWPMPLEGDSCEDAGLCGGGLVCNGVTCEPTFTRGPAACGYAGW